MRMSIAGWLIIAALVVFAVTSSVASTLHGVVRTYKMDDGLYDYTVGDMVHYSGQLIAELCLWWVARLKVRREKLPACVCQWAIDLTIVDLVYVLWGNPAMWEKQKIIMMAIATLMFFVVYYLDYIKLWHYHWIGCLKRHYHERFKKN